MNIKRDLKMVFKNGECITIPDEDWKSTDVQDGFFIVMDSVGVLLQAPVESVLYVYRPIV